MCHFPNEYSRGFLQVQEVSSSSSSNMSITSVKLMVHSDQIHAGCKSDFAILQCFLNILNVVTFALMYSLCKA